MRCADKKQASAQTCGSYPFEVNYHSHGIIKVLEPDRVLLFQKIMREDCITHYRRQEVYGKTGIG
jgi:hypothetical protein